MTDKKNTEDDIYALLGLTRDTNADEIRRAYHEAARRLHPDVNKRPGATEMFLEVQRAYEVLSDSKSRAAYDEAKKESDPEKIEESPLNLRVVYGRPDLVQIGEPQVVYVLLELSPAAEPATKTAAPLNLCLILDRSTSMQGERMDMLKAAATSLVRQLNSSDLLSVITFSDRAEILQSAGYRFDHKHLEDLIQSIRPNGGTEILQGLEAGFLEVLNKASNAYINHIVLFTDGRTYGDEADCLLIAEKAAEKGIGISAMGLGGEWNDVFLDSLSARTGGGCFYISEPKEINKFLSEKFRRLNQIYAEKVQLHLKTASGIQLRNAYRLQPEPAPLPCEQTLRLGSIEKGNRLNVLLEFLTEPITTSIEQLLIATSEITLDLPTTPGHNYRINLNFTRPVSKIYQPAEPPDEILQALSTISLYRMQERARREVEVGDIKGASLRLQRLATHLLAQGKRELAHTALVEAGRIQHTHAFSNKGEKEIKYGTRALFLPPGPIKETT